MPDATLLLLGAGAAWLLTRKPPGNGEGPTNPQQRAEATDMPKPADLQERDFSDQLANRPAPSDVSGRGVTPPPAGGPAPAQVVTSVGGWPALFAGGGFGSQTFDNHSEAGGEPVAGAMAEPPAPDLNTPEGRAQLTDEEFRFLFGPNTPRF